MGKLDTDACSRDLAAIVDSVARKDQYAMSTLYKQVSPTLYGVARRIVRSHECAQEIVCDVFTYVWGNAAAYDLKRGSLIGWLTIVTRNRAIDRLRSRRRYQVLSERLRLAGPATDLRPYDHLIQAENISALHGALASLPPLRRRLLTLAFFDDLSHNEIASMVGLPLGTVKSHLRRALRAVRDEVDRSTCSGRRGLRGAKQMETGRPCASRSTIRSAPAASPAGIERITPATSERKAHGVIGPDPREAGGGPRVLPRYPAGHSAHWASPVSAYSGTERLPGTYPTP